MAVWSILVRLLLKTVSLERSLRILDLLPRRRASSRTVAPPPESDATMAGACLGRSLARSQFLRTRAQPHTLVIGIRGAAGAFGAHAWLDGYDEASDDFVAIRRVSR